jgi:hypothetical protein
MSVEIPRSGTRGSKMPRAAIAVMGLMPGLYRLLGGRAMGPTLILTTIGAKTGQKRDAQLTAFPEGDGWLVVASKGGDATPSRSQARNFDGRPSHHCVEADCVRVRKPRRLRTKD